MTSAASASVLSGPSPAAATSVSPPPTCELPLEVIETELCALGAHIDAAVCRWLGLVAEFDRRKGFETWEMRSTAHWLSWKCGVSVSTAREQVRVARALEGLARIREAFAAGRLSYSKVRAITRIAHAENEQSLVELAEASTASVLDRICAQYHRHGQAGADERAERSHQQRELWWYHDDNGDVVFGGRMPAEMGAVFIKMIGAARGALDHASADAPGHPDHSENASADASGHPENASADASVHLDHASADAPGHLDHASADASDPSARESLRARNADALVLAAESFLVHGPVEREGSDRCDLTVIADLDTLVEGVDGACHLDGGPPLAAAVARRLACDCTASVVGLDRQGDPMYASRHQRIVNRRLRRALKVRDGHCTFPGCDRTAFLQAHHIVHWVNGGLTVMENLALVCGTHHRALHEGGHVMVRNPHGDLFVYGPDGRRYDNNPVHLDNPGTIETTNTAHGLTIDHRTHQCHWDNRRYDMSDIIHHLDQAHHRHLDHQRRRQPDAEPSDASIASDR